MCIRDRYRSLQVIFKFEVKSKVAIMVLRYLHYIFMLAAVGLVGRAVHLASRHEQLKPTSKSYAIESGSRGHYIVGYVVVGLMALQVVTGITLAVIHGREKEKDRSFLESFL